MALQCDQIGRNFATLAKVPEYLEIFDGLFLIWQICDIIVLILIVANGLILENNLQSGHTACHTRRIVQVER